MQQRGCSGARRALFVCTFAPDEPVAEVLQAASGLRDVEFRVTGDLRRLPARLRRDAPANVRWVGYLGPDHYVAALADADVVLSLTLREDSVARSAHDAVDALRPLVLSGGPHLRELFPYAVLVENRPEAIAEGVGDALRRCDELSGLAPEARSLQWRRSTRQFAELRTALQLDRSPAPAEIGD
jgi:hypothetical protein